MTIHGHHLRVPPDVTTSLGYARAVDATLEDIVGATLDDVTVDWRNGIVRITFLDSPKLAQSCAIRAIDFTRVEIGRGGLKGARRLVKSATRTGDAIEIVMESDEKLRVQSASFAIDALGG